MIKKTVTFKSFEGDEEFTDVFWFHLTKAELAEWEYSRKETVSALLSRISETSDTTQVFPVVKDILRRAYGIRDGVRFRKNAEISDDLTSHPAFSDIILDMLKDARSLAQFFAGVMPLDTVTEEQLMSAMEESKNEGEKEKAVDGAEVKNVFEQAENSTGPLPEVDPKYYGVDAVDIPGQPESTEAAYTEEALNSMSIEELREALKSPRTVE